MVEIDQHVFDLPDRRVVLVDLAADQLARPGTPDQCRIVDACYRHRGLRRGGPVALRLLRMSRGDGGETSQARRRWRFSSDISRRLASLGGRSDGDVPII
jgi:hypothetical protein